jgi:hypothetical protein
MHFVGFPTKLNHHSSERFSGNMRHLDTSRDWNIKGVLHCELKTYRGFATFTRIEIEIARQKGMLRFEYILHRSHTLFRPCMCFVTC